MDDDENSTAMPYYEVGELKKQLKKVQGKEFVDSDQLLNSMNNLTKTMDSMLQMFKSAADEMKVDEQEENSFSQQIKPLMDKIDEVAEQNKIIAEGMVAISDLIKERLPNRPIEIEQQKFPKMPPMMSRMPQQQQRPYPDMMPPPMPTTLPMSNMPPPMPNIPLMQNMPPPPIQGMMDMPPGMDLPPPPSPSQKKGMFGK